MSVKGILVASFAVTAGTSYACNMDDVKTVESLVVLSESEFHELNFQLLKGNVDKKNNSYSIPQDMYGILKEAGRIVKIDSKDSHNCVGNLTD